MKTENIIFFTAAAASVFLIIFIFVKKKQNKDKEDAAKAAAAANAITPTSPTTAVIPINPTTAPLNRNVTLRRGITGYANEVKALQKKINNIRSASLQIGEDGIFGNQTETALSQETQGQYDEISLQQFDVLFGTSGVGESAAPANATTPPANVANITTPYPYVGGAWNPFNWLAIT